MSSEQIRKRNRHSREGSDSIIIDDNDDEVNNLTQNTTFNPSTNPATNSSTTSAFKPAKWLGQATMDLNKKDLKLNYKDSSFKNISTIFGRHTRYKAVHSHSSSLFRLVRSLRHNLIQTVIISILSK